ncbi:ABC transporter family substrate-binding protein [Spelaeicoccus albus]|uniref:Peptide/nickel transport system substrate-binding protein n=1 Tax=Spelaeicoccus albus TaxID=1280376 RepID=A0A7Z0IJ58_9MICO|nr:ABC transporter family substrate-binding protein [Spelaeicoccus albus]NYI69082.1 peptide/nickel transport system substrate-binding protein [Spelaeicoccus albus]
MRFKKTLATLCALSFAAMAGCSSEDGSGNGGNAVTAEPPAGVSPDVAKIPMPEEGTRHDNPQARKNVKFGGSLKLAFPEIPPNLNSFSADNPSGYVGNLDSWTSPQLWDFTVGGQPKPDKDYLLSATVVSKSPEVIKYRLNPKAHWNNGDPITWKAFEATWKTQSGKSKKYNPSSTTGYERIKSVKKGKNAHEAVVTFDKPFYPYQEIFTQLENPKNLDPAFFKKGWVGHPNNGLLAGPFKYKSYSKTKVVLERNKDWWGAKPKLDTIVIRAMEDQASINAFQNGELDETRVESQDRMKQIKNMDDVQVRRGFGTQVSMYMMGQGSEVFKNTYARKAFALATDRRELTKIKFQGMNWDPEKLPGSMNVLPWMPTYKNNTPWLKHSVDKAKKLMTDHGWKLGEGGYFQKNGKTAKITYVNFGNSSSGAALARAQQAMAKQAGLKMVIDTRSTSDFSSTLNEGSYDVVAVSTETRDPFGYVLACSMYCTTSGNNSTGVGTKKIDAMAKKVTTIADPKKAMAQANKAEAAALNLVGYIPLFNSPVTYAVTKGLANYGPSGWASAEPEDIGWQKSK